MERLSESCLSKSRYFSLKEYIYGSEQPDDSHWDKGASHEFVNRVVGMIALVFICLLIIKVEEFFRTGAN